MKPPPIHIAGESLEDQLNEFRINYPGVMVSQYEDCLVYSVVPHYAYSASVGANLLIERLGLNLICIPKNHYPQDCFTIQEKK